MSRISPESASEPMSLEKPDGWIVKNKHGAIELFLHHERAVNAFNAWGSFIGPVYQRSVVLAPSLQQPQTLGGMIAAIYGDLDAEDFRMIDRAWIEWRGRGTIAYSLSSTVDPAPIPADPFNRKQVEAICRAVCAVEGVDPDDTTWTGDDPPWTRYADAVFAALSQSSTNENSHG